MHANKLDVALQGPRFVSKSNRSLSVNLPHERALPRCRGIVFW